MSKLQMVTGRRGCSGAVTGFIAAVFVLVSSAARAGDWAADAGDDAAYAKSKALCVKAKATALPKLAAPASIKADCIAWDLLEGIGAPKNAEAARDCAIRRLAKKDDGETWLQGSAILATLYANGQAVTRNYDVAIAYACQMEGAPEEMNSWIGDLATRKADASKATKPFDICDSVTSGQMGGFCAEIQGELADAARAVKLTALANRMDGPRKPLFDKLQKAEADFVSASVDNEVDVSGTARGQLIVDAKQKRGDEYVATLEWVLTGNLPKISPDALAGSDRAMNVAYGAIMKSKSSDTMGTVTKDGIKATQRKWLAYRNAFAAFARDPAAKDAVTDRLTRERTDALKELRG